MDVLASVRSHPCLAVRERRIRATMEQYLRFCHDERLQALPSSSLSVSAFLIWFVERQAGHTASITGKLSQLRCGSRTFFKAELLNRAEEYDVAQVIKALRFDDWTATKRMEPVTVVLLQRLAALRTGSSLIRLLLDLSRATAHNGLLRLGELVSKRKGRHITPRPGRRNGFTARLGRTKTARTGPGPDVAFFDHGPGSAAALERRWRRRTGRGPSLPDAWWLPELIVLASGEPIGIDWTKTMSRKTFVAALRFDLAQIGLDPRLYCGHSFRAGGATDLFASGLMTHAEVMTMGRWKSLAAALIYFRADLSAARKSAQVFRLAAQR
jgi:hypothetical protein